MVQRPQQIQQHLRAATDHFRNGQTSQAMRTLRRVLQRVPNDPNANSLAAQVLMKTGDLDQALYHAERAVASNPASAQMRSTTGLILSSMHRFDEAIEHYRKAMDLDPGHALAYIGLGRCHEARGEYEAAERVARQVIELTPERYEPRLSLAMLLLQTARAEEAMKEFFAALEFAPENLTVLDNLCHAMTLVDDVQPEDIFRIHKRYGDAVAKRAPREPMRHDNDRDPGRRLRVGYLSYDLHGASVAYFLEPILEATDRDAVETICYMTSHTTDVMTERLRDLSDQWRDAADLTDRKLAALINDDRVDILVDLGGHTHGNRLNVLAFRPVPVQATYCGYPDTTGLPMVDYRLIDDVTDPVREDGSPDFATETLYRLPGCFLCYRPPSEAPEPGAPPAGEEGPITFGSFNQIKKLTPTTARLWSEVMEAVPGSRLILKAQGLDDPRLVGAIRAQFRGNGIDDDRLELHGRMDSLADHLALYNRIDIALDTFPYNGTTTTCEALWMGLPVITIAGRVHASRVGASLLGAVGLSDLVAHTHEELADIAIGAAMDRWRLADMRRDLRAQVAASPLCDSAGFARNLEGAYRDMWRRWCERAAPGSL